MGRKEIDKYSYELGVTDCFCEMVSSGLKTLAMSHPCDTKEERDSYLDEVKRITERYGILYYQEDEALLTPLFPEEANKDKYNYLFFRTQDVLEEYLRLKDRRRYLTEAGQYSAEASLDIARAFGRLLSYPEEGIERLIRQADRGNGQSE